MHGPGSCYSEGKEEGGSKYPSSRMHVNQDLPCTLNWGYMFPNSGYLGPNIRIMETKLETTN